jgi:hypothetical protein
MFQRVIVLPDPNLGPEDWNLLPIAQALWLKDETYIDFPPLQNPASYNLDQVIQQGKQMKTAVARVSRYYRSVIASRAVPKNCGQRGFLEANCLGVRFGSMLSIKSPSSSALAIIESECRVLCLENLLATAVISGLFSVHHSMSALPPKIDGSASGWLLWCTS